MIHIQDYVSQILFTLQIAEYVSISVQSSHADLLQNVVDTMHSIYSLNLKLGNKTYNVKLS